MNVLGFAKNGSALIADWDDAWCIVLHFGTANKNLFQSKPTNGD